VVATGEVSWASWGATGSRGEDQRETGF
jgi:hypothetical protein